MEGLLSTGPTPSSFFNNALTKTGIKGQNFGRITVIETLVVYVLVKDVLIINLAYQSQYKTDIKTFRTSVSISRWIETLRNPLLYRDS